MKLSDKRNSSGPDLTPFSGITFISSTWASRQLLDFLPSWTSRFDLKRANSQCSALGDLQGGRPHVTLWNRGFESGVESLNRRSKAKIEGHLKREYVST